MGKEPEAGPRLELGARVDVEITGVGRHLDGTAAVGPSTLFIPGTAPGDRVEVEIDTRFKHGWRAAVVDWAYRSPDRAEPRCPYFGRCAGCQFQHLAYEAQVRLKIRELRRCLADASLLADDAIRETLVSPADYGYRNRITIHGPGGYGFWRIGGRAILEIDRCPICLPGIGEALRRLRDPGAADRFGGVANLLLRAGSGGDLFVGSETGTTPREEWIREEIRDSAHGIGLSMHVDPRAFWQGNTPLLPSFIRLVRDAALELQPDRILDFYCGAGIFSLAVSSGTEHVVGVDSHPGAIASARQSALSMPHGRRCAFIQALAEEHGPGLLRDIDPAGSAIILDPPRSGMPPALLAAILDMAPRRLVYVSCNPEALARDLRILLGIGHGIASPFRLRDIIPVDLFPQTRHLEVVAVLNADPPGRERA